MKYLTIVGTTGQVLCRAGRAESLFARMRGLLGLRGLPAGEGLLLAPCSGIHTLGMRFAIAAVYLDSEWRILKVDSRIPPGRWFCSGGLRTRRVLELAADDPAVKLFRVGEKACLRSE